MLSATATMEPRYLVSVGSTWLRFMVADITATTLLISQRPMIQKAMAEMILMASAEAVVVRKILTASRLLMSMRKAPESMTL